MAASPKAVVDPVGEPIPTSAVLTAASKHIGIRCQSENVAFLKCKKKDPNPEKCLERGRDVTRCVLGLLICRVRFYPRSLSDHFVFLLGLALAFRNQFVLPSQLVFAMMHERV
ncbi:hypothetical protein ACFE04_013002 [Oxalis oulophora]